MRKAGRIALMDGAGLAARSISAVFWGANGTVVRMLLQIGSQMVLARILGPTEYGVFAIGSLVITFSLFFADIGLAYGLIQKPRIDSEDIRFVFSWQILLGTTVAIVIALSAAYIAEFFNEPRLFFVVRAMALLCLVNALAAPAINLLKRDLNYRALQAAQIGSYFVGFVLVGIPLALAGYEVWSLVAAWSTQAILAGIICYLLVRHPIKPLLWYADAKGQGAYGVVVLATNLLNWVIANVDRIVVGRLLPSHDMGLYSQTYNLLYSPSTNLLGVVQPVFFAAASRAAGRDGQAETRRAFLALLGAVALFVAPVFAAVAVLAEPFVLTLYGDKWRAAAAVCAPIALAMPLFLMFGLCTPLLWTAGRPSDEMRSQWPMALAWAFGCLWAAPHGVVAVAWGVLVFFALRLLVVLRITARRTALRVVDLWRALRGGLTLSLLLALALSALDHALIGLSAPQRLGSGAAAGLAVALALLRLFPHLVSAELRSLVERVLHRLPVRVGRHLAFLGRRDREAK